MSTKPTKRAPVVAISATATDMNVRNLIDELREGLRSAGIGDDLRGTVALAVGEALNNIVEHAYGSEVGPVELTAELLCDEIRVTLQDHGRALPGNAPPPAYLPSTAGPRETLPEGGFGWFLIHKLCRSLAYNRRAGKNTLCLSFSRNDTPQ